MGEEARAAVAILDDTGAPEGEGDVSLDLEPKRDRGCVRYRSIRGGVGRVCESFSGQSRAAPGFYKLVLLRAERSHRNPCPSHTAPEVSCTFLH